ncbi:hypothetical protein D3C81_1410720 [compost metagenome]
MHFQIDGEKEKLKLLSLELIEENISFSAYPTTKSIVVKCINSKDVIVDALVKKFDLNVVKENLQK